MVSMICNPCLTAPASSDPRSLRMAASSFRVTAADDALGGLETAGTATAPMRRTASVTSPEASFSVACAFARVAPVCLCTE